MGRRTQATAVLLRHRAGSDGALTVTAENGCERELRITPWNGAFVVVSLGTHSTLTGYDVDGNVRGTLSTRN
jgi:hypothetical protein